MILFSFFSLFNLIRNIRLFILIDICITHLILLFTLSFSLSFSFFLCLPLYLFHINLIINHLIILILFLININFLIFIIIIFPIIITIFTWLFLCREWFFCSNTSCLYLLYSQLWDFYCLVPGNEALLLYVQDVLEIKADVQLYASHCSILMWVYMIYFWLLICSNINLKYLYYFDIYDICKYFNTLEFGDNFINNYVINDWSFRKKQQKLKLLNQFLFI